MNLNQLRKEFPGLAFTHVPAWQPEGTAFVRIENPWGGGDTVPVGNGGLVRHLAAWHQGRVDARAQKAA